jgi:hypothetical protein
LNTNSVVIPSARQSNRQNIRIETKWSRNLTAQTRDICGRVYRQSGTTTGKPTSYATDTNVLLPDKLNIFFTRFEDNRVPPTRLLTKDCRLAFSVADVSKTFKRVNPHKAAGPDGIPSRILRACADQLAGVFMDIFNLSLSKYDVPTCFKMATIVPVPKKAKITELNDSPLTSVIRKCFERLVKDHITSTLPDTLDPLTTPIDPQTMQSPSHCTLAHSIWTRGIPM